MVKEKPNSTRIYDKDGFRQRAACICVRSIDEDEVRFPYFQSIEWSHLTRFSLALFQVLLVTSSRRPDNWIVPGGGVEPNELSEHTAVREVLEEAGVVGTLGRCLGMFEVRTNDKFRVNQSIIDTHWLLFFNLEFRAQASDQGIRDECYRRVGRLGGFAEYES